MLFTFDFTILLLPDLDDPHPDHAGEEVFLFDAQFDSTAEAQDTWNRLLKYLPAGRVAGGIYPVGSQSGKE